MAPTSMKLEGRNLGEKHRNYNELVKQAIANKTVVEPGDLNSGENDVAHLMKIDIASNDRDVEYIMQVLKCEDIMYVTRAIKQSHWLTEQQYAHIINANYLHTNLFPEMTVNAKTMFMKFLRLNLQDEARAEQFFEYEVQNNVNNAVKWLPNCSDEFIVFNAQKYLLKSKDCKLFKRLCEKTPDVLQILIHEDAKFVHKKLHAAKFLLHSAPEKYLDIIDKHYVHYQIPQFGARSTGLLMQKCPNLIINKFRRYYQHIHMPTFVQYLKKNELKDFLLLQAKNTNDEEPGCYSIKDCFFMTPRYIKYFIDAMTVEERSEFLDQVFINKVHSREDEQEESEKHGIRLFYRLVTQYPISEYIYYDFDTAFDKITQEIKHAESQDEKASLLNLLVKCAACDSRNIQTLLKYYYENHVKDLKSTERLVKSVLPKINITMLDSESWRILNEMFQRLETYSALDGCVETIVVYKAIHGENITQEIEEEFMKNYKTLKSYQKTLNKEQKAKVFTYLYDRITCNIQNNNITNETEFRKSVNDLKFALNLLKDWEKKLADFPWILDKINEYIKIKRDHSWKSSMESVYTVNKSWKKLMFDKSIELCPTESVCLNALKHDAQLLSLDRDEVNALRCNDKAALQRFLKKLRTYWSNTLSAEWTQRYLDGLHQQNVQKAVVRGLCALLPRQQLLQLIHNYAPKQEKIIYKEVADIPLDVQKHLAKCMMIARPRPPPDAVLLYAKGDYLKFALPSLLAILHNANLSQSRNFITGLLSAPVSLQKHGIRLVSAKFTPKEALTIYYEIWMSTSNATIRAVVFQYTISLLNNDETLQRDVWEVMFLFIRNLTHDEDKTIYEILYEEKYISKLPESLIPEYIITTYKFFNELIPKLSEKDQHHYEGNVWRLTQRTKHYMDRLPAAFVLNILTKFIEDDFIKKEIFNNDTLDVIATFVLCSRGDKTQMERYNLLLPPLLQRCIASWDETDDRGDYFIRKNVNSLLNQLASALLKYVLVKEMAIPLTIFEDVQQQLNMLSVPENYIMLTKWKLTVEFTRMLQTQGFINKNWNAFAPEFGMKCLEYLKSDVTSYFPCIFMHFSKALTGFMEICGMPITSKMIILQCLLSDAEFIQGYLSVIYMYPKHNTSEVIKEKCIQLRNRLSEHPSMEVKMHYIHMIKA
ncbi:hypothetical protein O0L34_g14994 [Tuta absoluta]|nr:hypothetical protein O0L34_g14994 [Tuta absoluta]